MFDGSAYITSFKVETIEERCKERGSKLLELVPGLLLPVDHIKGFYDFDSTLATKVRVKAEANGTNNSFVRGTQKENNIDFIWRRSNKRSICTRDSV